MTTKGRAMTTRGRAMTTVECRAMTNGEAGG
jgi:hypothetical protein